MCSAALAQGNMHACTRIVGTVPSPYPQPPSLNPQMCCAPGYVSGYAGHGRTVTRAFVFALLFYSLLFRVMNRRIDHCPIRVDRSPSATRTGS